MNKLHAIWMLCASLVLPSMVFAVPTITLFTINGDPNSSSPDNPNTNRNIEAVVVVNPSKVTGAGSVVNKVAFFIDGVLKSTVVVPSSVVTNPGPPAAPKTYTFKFKTTVTAGARIFKAVAYENSIPASSTTSPTLSVEVVDAAPEITEIICAPNAINYVANPTASVSASAKVKDDVKVTKVEFYWVPLPNLPDPYEPSEEPGTLKSTVMVNALSGTATYLYTGIQTSGEMRILAYDELGNQPTQSRKLIKITPNAAPNCGPELSITDPNTEVISTFTSPVVKNGATVVEGSLFNPGTITIQIAAQDETGTVTKMELFNNNVLFATSTTATAIPGNVFSKPPYYLFTFTFPAIAAGTYKLSWKATDSYGAFCVSNVDEPYVLTVNRCTDPNEPANNVKTGATTLGLTSLKYAKIASATDVDWYKITTVGGPLSVFLSGSDATGAQTDLPADFDIALYANSGKSSTTPLLVEQNDGTTPEVLDLSNVTAGTYLLKVYGYGDPAAIPVIPNAFSASCYRLQVTDEIAGRRSLGKSTKKPIPTEAAPVSMLLVPNPASNQVTLLTGVENAGEYQLAITDILGREVKRQTLTLNEGDNVSTLDISTIGKGMYVVRLWNSDQQLTQKLTVEK